MAGVSQTNTGKFAIAVSADIHYSVSRAAGIIGTGQNNILRLPLNYKRQICVRSAIAVIEAARLSGRETFCIVASAGSTPVGAIDPLDELADYARSKGIWLHVDAAHCGAYLLSDKLRPHVRGIEKADSFSVDAHKTMFVPALCTLLFYRDRVKARGAFSQDASYVFNDREDVMSRFESGAKNFECTKRPAIVNLWLVWAMFGPRVIAEKLEYLIDLTWNAYAYLSLLSDFSVIHEPQSIFCALHTVRMLFPREQVSDLQLALWNRFRDGGEFFISKVQLEGRNVLRMVLMNHEIDISHIVALTAAIRRAAVEITQEWGIASFPDVAVTNR